ncbi:MAG TPA: prepilin-type N-terminal cleavage/methylation domain-containing protein [Blastocatellia bacterium]|nr:prepilin-type N-terminal cleavage/methylation domain-containing protein [Blastocatellia bacterium]
MKRNAKGFSLPELLIVVAVIGIIATIAIPGLLEAQRASREAAAIQTLRTIVESENTYLSVKGNYTSYGDGSQLSGASLVDASLFSSPINNYQLTLTLGSPASTYSATNEPVGASATAKSHFYFVANDGLIRWKAGSTAGPSDPPIPQ